MAAPSQAELDAVRRLRADLPLYAEKFLRIRTKSGAILPLKLNAAQTIIHHAVEKMRAEIGKVRVLILKGRQEGACFAPHHKVLMYDLTWRSLSDVKPGDEVVAVDEEIGDSGLTIAGRNTCRRFKKAAVEVVAHLRKRVIRVRLASGRELTVTPEHRMLFRRRGGVDAQWRTMGAAKVGDVIRSAFRAPAEHPPTFEDGWFAGILDGEGHRSSRSESSVSVCVTQRNGAVLDRCKAYLDGIGVRYYETVDDRPGGNSSKLGCSPVHRLEVGRLADVAALMERCRTSRIRFDGDDCVGRKIGGNRTPNGAGKQVTWDEIVSIEDAGEIDVIDLQTSAKTYIVEGLVSHNSTYTAARMFHRVTLNSGLLCAVMTHEQDSTDALFGMAQRFQEHLPGGLKLGTRAASAKELAFETDSGYIVATAGNKAAGRGRTIQLFHGSEVASWPHADDHMAGIGQTVPDEPGTEIILESTAKGLGNLWHRMCMQAVAGRGDYRLIFVPWFVMPEYRRPVRDDFMLSPEEEEYKALHDLDDEQMAFRRAKIDSDFAGDVSRWCEEYPATIEEAFQAESRETFIQAADVRAARGYLFPEPRSAPLILGVDPARFGPDRTAFCYRAGRIVTRMEARQGLDTMQVAGLVVNAIRAHRPVKVFIDVVGLGAGVVDRLLELDYGEIVVPVNGAERPHDPDRYRNRRAECWARMKDWLRERPVSIPDSDALAQDLLQPGYEYDSNSRLLIESKDKISKRGAPSPDLADALSLTFAELVAAETDGDPLVRQSAYAAPRRPMADSIGY